MSNFINDPHIIGKVSVYPSHKYLFIHSFVCQEMCRKVRKETKLLLSSELAELMEETGKKNW